MSGRLTLGVEEGHVEVPGKQRLRQVPEVLLEQLSHVVGLLALLVQVHLAAAVELLAELRGVSTPI